MTRTRYLDTNGGSQIRTPLRTARLVLEWVGEAHAELLLKELRAPALYANNGVMFPLRIGQLRTYFREAKARNSARRANRTLLWAAVTQDGGRHVGLFEVSIDRGGRANLGYVVFPHSWGCGYATEACQAILSYLFDLICVHRVEVVTEWDNHRSRRVAEKLGGRLSGSADMAAVYVITSSTPRRRLGC